jgi:DNA-binding transcriptional ArsR family regulator/2-polyprenyl-3-methyl-5-hydroxy-6-metoxy-1,4-benzoquinol methylase
MHAYSWAVLDADLARSPRWELYRVLAEPMRLRLLALAAEEELGIGELAELLGENQSNVSRHAAALRQAGVLRDRKEGTRTLVSVSAHVAADPVVADALASGRALCESEGSLARIADVVRAREAPAHEFFARPAKNKDGAPSEAGAYWVALGQLLPRRSLALDAGTGDGRLLDVLSPVFDRVVGVDRAAAQLARARERVAARGLANVTLVQGELDSPELQKALAGTAEPGEAFAGADVVFASRVLHHAPQPARVTAQLASLCAPGGALVVVDYERHDDESMRDQADAWLGFDASTLRKFARAAGLEDARVTKIAASFCGDGADAHLPWQVLVARRPRNAKGKNHG